MIGRGIDFCQRITWVSPNLQRISEIAFDLLLKLVVSIDQKKGKTRDGIECGGSILESGGDDVYNICANLVRKCLKEPFKAESINREKVRFSLSKWADGKPQKPVLRSDTPDV